MYNSLSSEIIKISASLIALVFSITTHEAAHGFIALRYGDDTARRMGRLTFNPLPHIDLMGTVLLPAFLFIVNAPFLFGWAKPVPVDFHRLKPPRIGMFMVAFAGPGINLILAWLSVVLLHINGQENTFGNEILLNSFYINTVLAIFNLLPILPLDGGRMVTACLPPKAGHQFAQLEPYGSVILMIIVLLPAALTNIGVDFNPLFYILRPPLEGIRSLILFLGGY